MTNNDYRITAIIRFPTRSTSFSIGNDTTETMISAIFSWWIVDSPKKLLFIIKKTLVYLYHTFSIGYLAKTLLAPWKRDIREIINPTLQDRFKMLIDNLISRFMGFIVRLLTIFVGLAILAGAFVLGIVVFVIWFLLPFIIVFLIYLGIILT